MRNPIGSEIGLSRRHSMHQNLPLDRSIVHQKHLYDHPGYSKNTTDLIDCNLIYPDRTKNETLTKEREWSHFLKQNPLFPLKWGREREREEKRTFATGNRSSNYSFLDRRKSTHARTLTRFFSLSINLKGAKRKRLRKNGRHSGLQMISIDSRFSLILLVAYSTFLQTKMTKVARVSISFSPETHCVLRKQWQSNFQS